MIKLYHTIISKSIVNLHKNDRNSMEQGIQLSLFFSLRDKIINFFLDIFVEMAKNVL